MIEPVGATSHSAIHSRIQSQLGPNEAGLAKINSTQQTIGQGPPIRSVELTEAGAVFVETHRAELSMPTDIAELAKRVAALELEDSVIDNLIYRVEVLEGRVEEL